MRTDFHRFGGHHLTGNSTYGIGNSGTIRNQILCPQCPCSLGKEQMYRSADTHQNRIRTEPVLQHRRFRIVAIVPLQLQQLLHALVKAVLAVVRRGMLQQHFGHGNKDHMGNLGINFGTQLFQTHLERLGGKACRRNGSLPAETGVISTDMHDIGRCQTAAQNDAGTLQCLGVKVIFVDFQCICCLLQVQRTGFQQRTQPDFRFCQGKGTPVGTVQREKFMQRQGMGGHTIDLFL